MGAFKELVHDGSLAVLGWFASCPGDQVDLGDGSCGCLPLSKPLLSVRVILILDLFILNENRHAALHPGLHRTRIKILILRQEIGVVSLRG